MRTLTDIKHLVASLSLAVVVFGATGWYAHSVAAELHHTTPAPS